jgi:hypothetical protein
MIATQEAIMSIVDDLIENLVERNAIDVNGTFTISVINGGVSVKGHVLSTVRDERKKKEILKTDAPIDAQVTIGTIVVPLPEIKSRREERCPTSILSSRPSARMSTRPSSRKCRCWRSSSMAPSAVS